jgi:hypothetical protein
MLAARTPTHGPTFRVRRTTGRPEQWVLGMVTPDRIPS